MENNTNLQQMSFFKDMAVTLDSFGSFGFQSVDSYLHRHGDYYEIILGISGNYKHTYNGKTTDFTRGMLLLLAPFSVHRLYTEPMEAVHFVLCVEQNYFLSFAKQHFPAFSVESLPELSTANLDAKEIDYLELLGHRLCTPSPSKYSAEAITYFTLMNIFTLMSKHHGKSVYYVDRIINILNNPVNLNMSSKALCNQFTESTPTILKNFKKQTGYTIIEYKNKKKMEIAADMLRNSAVKVTDIAYELQYNSLSYFLHAFKEEYGVTPSEYREKYSSTK